MECLSLVDLEKPRSSRRDAVLARFESLPVPPGTAVRASDTSTVPLSPAFRHALQNPAAAASSIDVNTYGSHVSGRGRFPSARNGLPGDR